MREIKDYTLTFMSFDAELLMQYHVPIELPDENLYGLIARFVRINGEAHLKGCNAFLGKKQFSIADSSVEKSADGLFDGFYQNDSRSTFTFEKLHQHLGGTGSQNVNQVKPSTTNSLLRSSFGEQQYWRYCEMCCAAEIEKYGVAYWHLEHQIPTSLICLKHQLPLAEIKHKKKITHHHLWLIEESLHHAKHYDDLALKHWVPMATIGHQALNDKSPPSASQVINATLIEALKEKGLVDAKGKLKISSFEFAFRRSFDSNFEKELKDRLNIKKPRYLVTDLFQSKEGRILNRLILIYWLFGSWEYFKSCCNWYEIFNQPLLEDDNAPLEKYTIESMFKKYRDENRSICLTYIQSTDCPNRQEFGRLFYKKFSWLLNNDRAWLDRMLPLGKAFQHTLNF